MATPGSTQSFDNPAGTLNITDSRTGTSASLPIADNAIRARTLADYAFSAREHVKYSRSGELDFGPLPTLWNA